MAIFMFDIFVDPHSSQKLTGAFCCGQYPGIRGCGARVDGRGQDCRGRVFFTALIKCPAVPLPPDAEGCLWQSCNDQVRIDYFLEPFRGDVHEPGMDSRVEESRLGHAQLLVGIRPTISAMDDP